MIGVKRVPYTQKISGQAEADPEDRVVPALVAAA